MPEEEGEEKGTEEEEKRTEDEELPSGVTRFPTPSGSDGVPLSSDHVYLEETKRVASLLKLPVSEQLGAIVHEFLQTPTISLVGEAIEARAWIEDAQRNSRGQQMTPAFFRRWLKRERGDYGFTERSGKRVRSAGSKARTEDTSAPVSAPNAQAADDPYRTYVLQRMAEVEAKYHQEAAS